MLRTGVVNVLNAHTNILIPTLMCTCAPPPPTHTHSRTHTHSPQDCLFLRTFVLLAPPTAASHWCGTSPLLHKKQSRTSRSADYSIFTSVFKSNSIAMVNNGTVHAGVASFPSPKRWPGNEANAGVKYQAQSFNHPYSWRLLEDTREIKKELVTAI